MSVAALVAGWEEWTGGPFDANGSGGTYVPTFPTENLPLGVELQLNGVWTDVTGYVRYADKIKISRGRSNERTTSEPASCALTFDNRDGRFSPRNPLGAWFGLIGRNTPLRVFVQDPRAPWVRRYRFHGEVSEWPVAWDPTGTDVYARVVASDVRRRLSQGASPLKSAYRRAATGVSTPFASLVGYWPMEDAVGSARMASGLAGGTSLGIVGSPTLASDSTFNCSAALPVLNSGWFRGPVSSSNTGEIQVMALMSIPTGTTNNAVLMSFRTTGTAGQWNLIYTTGGSLTLNTYDSDLSLVVSNGPYAFLIEDKLLRIGVHLTQNGSDIDFTISTLEVGESTGGFASSTVASRTVGACREIQIGPSANIVSGVIGQVTVQSEVTSVFENYKPLNAYDAEDAGVRFERLCSEEGLTGYAFDSIAPYLSSSFNYMGPQGQKTLVDLLRECENTDKGFLSDLREDFGLRLRLMYGLQRQAVDLSLSYSAADLSNIEPVEDDQNLVNDLTLTRAGGGSYRYVDETTALGTEAVGTYDASLEVSLSTDDNLPDQASWRVAVGTVDQPRLPTLGIDLARSNFAVGLPVNVDVYDLDIGDRVDISNPPGWMDQETISQVVIGMAETLDQRTHQISMVCTPYEPYRIAVYGSARYESDGFTTITSDIDSTTTSIPIDIVEGPGWGHADGDYDVLFGGEAATVTAVSGTAPTQTLTVTRSVNGVVKPHGVGTEVTLRERHYYGWKYA